MIALDNRLKTAAELCRDGKTAADIGCDHARLACWLALNKSMKVIAADVRDGPLEAARRTVSEQGVSNVEVVKSDGLAEIDFADDVIICGMGGELIAEIIGGCRFLNQDTRFVLQPMTKANFLRCWLCENGFEIIEERAAYDGDKIYAIIHAKYTGEIKAPDELFALCGKMTDSGYLRKTAEKLLKQAAGLERSEPQCGELEKIRALADAILKMAEEFNK